MAVTFTKLRTGFEKLGRKGYNYVIPLFDAYPAGGYDFDSGKLNTGNGRVFGVHKVADGGSSFGYQFSWDRVNKKCRIFSGGGTAINVYTPGGGDIKGSAFANVPIASGALPTNGALISALITAANTTSVTTFAAQPDIPRNIGISFKNASGGASTGNAVSCLITGTFRGAAQTETISFTALELTSTANNEVATKYGSKPFTFVTSVTFPVAQPAGWEHAIGIGSKLGLPTNLLTPAVADVTKITRNAADLPVSAVPGDAGGVTPTLGAQVVNLGTLADGADVAIEYLQTTAAGEMATGTDASGLTPTLCVITL